MLNPLTRRSLFVISEVLLIAACGSFAKKSHHAPASSHADAGASDASNKDGASPPDTATSAATNTAESTGSSAAAASGTVQGSIEGNREFTLVGGFVTYGNFSKGGFLHLTNYAFADDPCKKYFGPANKSGPTGSAGILVSMGWKGPFSPFTRTDASWSWTSSDDASLTAHLRSGGELVVNQLDEKSASGTITIRDAEKGSTVSGSFSVPVCYNPY